MPRGVVWLLRIGLPADQREPVAGDLEEEYAARRQRDGAIPAAVALWWLAARLAWAFWWERAAYGRPLPPIADEIRMRPPVWETLWQDAAFGTRLLFRRPGFTLASLITLALGIGANTAMFSIVDTVLWRPLPYPRAERMVSLAEQRPREGRFFGPVAPADFFDWRRDARSFSAVAAYDATTMNLTGAGEPERVRGLRVSAGFLDVLASVPALGRNFRLEEENPGQHRVVLLTDSFWRRRFGAAADILGRRLTFDGVSYEVVGVLPSTFWWRSRSPEPAPTQADVLVPLALSDHDRGLRAAHFLEVVARLAPGVSLTRGREELNVIGARLSQAYPVENRFHAPNVRLLHDALVGDVRTALLLLLGAVVFVLLIACANVAMLLVARASGRQKELSVRRAMGATRSRLVQQMLTESVLISLAGGAAGLLIAGWALAGIRSVLPAQFSGLPGIERVALDMRVLLAALAMSAITGLVFGTVPAAVASDRGLGMALTEQLRGGSGSRRAQRLRSTLVVAELALSLVLAAGAALMIVSFKKLIDVSPGFQPGQLVTVPLTLPADRYRDHARIVAFYDAVFDRLRSSAGIQHVAATTALPFSGPDSRLDLEIERRGVESPLPVRAHPRLASPDYFRTMGIPIVRGRYFTDQDHASTPAVAIINEAAARRYWPTEDPIGQRISLGTPQRWREVVGIAGDIKQEGLDTEAEPAVFMPHRQTFEALGAGLARRMTLVVRTSADVAGAAPLLRAAVAAVDSEQPLGLVRSMEGLIGESIAPRRLNLLLVSAFAVLALVLTAAGLYGVMAYLVAQRTREIGVRVALGASPARVVGLVLRQVGAMTFAGIIVGLLGALGVSRFVRGLLYGVSPTDVRVYAAVSALLAMVALLAVAIPCSRATRVDPIEALRDS